MRRRLAELERAETVARQVASQPPQMATETQRQPQYSERDLEFLRSRPGVEKDPRLPVVAHAFAATLGHATDEYYVRAGPCFSCCAHRT